MPLHALVKYLFKTPTEREKWSVSVRLLKAQIDLLAEDEQSFVLIMERRLQAGIPLLAQHAKRIEEMIAALQDACAY